MGLMPAKKPYSVFIQANSRPYMQKLYCMSCGQLVARVVGEITNVVDSSGYVKQVNQEPTRLVELVCSRSTCHQRFILYL